MQLEAAIRAACDVAEEAELYVIGSQSILGAHPHAPASLLHSMEVDVVPKTKPEAWEWIDGALGELSLFNTTHGFYVQGLDRTTAKLPVGWESRCIPVRTSAGTGLCLEPPDLALSKLAAFREKDRTFVRTLLVEGIVDQVTLFARLSTLPVDDRLRQQIADWISETTAAL
jgi:hypothetical protein